MLTHHSCFMFHAFMLLRLHTKKILSLHTRKTNSVLDYFVQNYTNGYAVEAESIHFSFTENASRLFIWCCLCKVGKKKEIHQIKTYSFRYYSNMLFQHIVLEQNLQSLKVFIQSSSQNNLRMIHVLSVNTGSCNVCFWLEDNPGPDILKGRYCPFPVKCQHTKDVIMQNCKFYSGAQ